MTFDCKVEHNLLYPYVSELIWDFRLNRFKLLKPEKLTGIKSGTQGEVNLTKTWRKFNLEVAEKQIRAIKDIASDINIILYILFFI